MSGQEQVLHTAVDSLGIAFFMDIKLVTTHRQSGKKILKRLNNIKLVESSDTIDSIPSHPFNKHLLSIYYMPSTF